MVLVTVRKTVCKNCILSLLTLCVSKSGAKINKYILSKFSQNLYLRPDSDAESCVGQNVLNQPIYWPKVCLLVCLFKLNLRPFLGT